MRTLGLTDNEVLAALVAVMLQAEEVTGAFTRARFWERYKETADKPYLARYYIRAGIVETLHNLLQRFYALETVTADEVSGCGSISITNVVLEH